MAFHKYHLPSTVPFSVCFYKRYGGMSQGNLLQFVVLAQLQRVICPQNGKIMYFQFVPCLLRPSKFTVLLFNLAGVSRLSVGLIVKACVSGLSEVG